MSPANGASPLDDVAMLGVLKYLEEAVKSGKTSTVAPAVLAKFPPGSRVPVQVGGQFIGWMTVPQPSTKATVTGEAAYLRWVQEYHPSEIVTEPSVRESFTALVLKAAKEKGGWLNKGNGEYEPVPGVTVSTGDPYTRVELEPAAGPAIAAAWRDGRIDLGRVLALPAAPGEAPQSGEAA